jgi:hypothetical protein
MIDYKYPTIASGATPIGSAGRAPDENYFEKNEEENFESMDSNISLPSGERIQEPDNFWALHLKSKFEEAEDI